MPIELTICCLAAALACVRLGGGLYETGLVDAVWPWRPDIVQPSRGGLSRKRFWIPAHAAFELSLLACLALSWSRPEVRAWLLAALVCQGVMRVWSALDFIPKALAFERAEPSALRIEDALRWTRRSRLRLPLDLATCTFMLLALVASARAG